MNQQERTSPTSSSSSDLTLFDRIASLHFSPAIIPTVTFSPFITTPCLPSSTNDENEMEDDDNNGEHLQRHEKSSSSTMISCNQFIHYIPILSRIYLSLKSSTTHHENGDSRSNVMKRQLYRVLQPFALTSTVLAYEEQLDWHNIEHAISNEMKTRKKLYFPSSSSSSPNSGDDDDDENSDENVVDDEKQLKNFAQFCARHSLAYDLGHELIMQFEDSSIERRAQLLLSELTTCVQYVRYVKHWFKNSHSNSRHMINELISSSSGIGGVDTGGAISPSSSSSAAASSSSSSSSSLLSRANSAMMGQQQRRKVEEQQHQQYQQHGSSRKAVGGGGPLWWWTPSRLSNLLHFNLLNNELYKREVSYILCAAYHHTNGLFTLEELISVLCACSYHCAKDHICLFVMNNPSTIDSVVRYLVDCEVEESMHAATKNRKSGSGSMADHHDLYGSGIGGGGGGDDEGEQDLIPDLLQTLSTFSKHVAYNVRTCCLDRGILPQICIFNSLSIIRDSVRFLNSCLNSINDTQFVFQMIHKLPSNDDRLKLLRSEITETIRGEKVPLALKCSALRLCCGLSFYSNMCGLENEEQFSMLVKIALQSSHSHRLVHLVISILLLYSPISMNTVLPCLKELIDELWQKNQCHDTLLLIATYFHAQLYRSLSGFIGSTANIPSIEMSNELYDTIRPVITEELIPLDMLAKEILKIAPKFIRAGEDWYAMQCVYRMLQSRLFRKHSVDASQWVYRQMQCFTDQDPVPTLVPDLINELVSNCTPHPNFTFQMALFTSAQILQVVDDSNVNMTTKAIMLYYILTVNANNAIAESYGYDVLARSHVIEIVNFLHSERTRLGPLYSQLLSLIIDQLQHLFHLDLILTSNKSIPRFYDSSSTWQTTSQLLQVLSHPLNDQKKTKMVFDYLSTLSAKEFVPLERAAIQVLPQLLDRKVRRYVLNSYENLWRAMCLRTPMQLSLDTINSLHPLVLTHDDIYKNILVVFGINRRVFECPALVGIFLQILNSFMIASRKSILSTKNLQKNADQSVQNSYVITQEATILQLLLEICILDSEGTGADAVDPGDRAIIQKLICSFVHQRFIENPVLAKLLHFQTYDPRLLPITVNGINSIHICMDFLVELLSQPQLEKQVFGVQLAAYLCEKYPLPRCTEIACAAINRIRQIGQLTGSFTNKTVEASTTNPGLKTSDASKIIPGAQGTVLTKATKAEYLSAIKQLIDVLVRLTVAFPFLSIDCIRALDELKTNFRQDEDIMTRVKATFQTISTTVLNNVNK